MEASVDKPPFAWQPLTPRGVAVFARASAGRLVLVQFLVALLAAGATVWSVYSAWFPTISAAIEHLPARGEIRSGGLNWTGDSPVSLAESRFLALAVDLNHQGTARSAAHIQVEFGQADIRVFSLFGCRQHQYPKRYVMAFNRQDLKPWWGAWAPVILAATAAGTVIGLMATWALLATLYCLPAWLVGFYSNRSLSLCGSWRLAGAALMPGALFLTGAIVLYGLGELDLIQLLLSTGVHFALGWVYLVWATLATPRLQAEPGPRVNPFVTPTAAPTKPEDEAAKTGPADSLRAGGD